MVEPSGPKLLTIEEIFHNVTLSRVRATIVAVEKQ